MIKIEIARELIVPDTFSNARVYQGTQLPSGGITTKGLVAPPDGATYSHKVKTGPDGTDDTGGWTTPPEEQIRRPGK